MRVIAIIPARGGSKGVPRKNIRILGGIPLIGWVCQSAIKSKHIAELLCSTDSEEIASICNTYGVKTPYLRPSELATDEALVIDTLRHTLDHFDPEGTRFEYVCVIQATSPFVTPAMLDEAIELAFEQNADTVISGALASQHPSTMFKLDSDRVVRWILQDDARMRRRQEFEPVLRRCGAVYVIRASMIRESRRIYGERICAIQVDEVHAMTIDTEMDFKLAEFFVQEGMVDFPQ